MPFGFSKKDKDKDDEKQRSALFGNRSKESKSSAAQANPYAVQAPTNDPYSSKETDPYVPKTSSQPPPYDNNGGHQLRQDKSPVPIGGYGGGSGGPPQPRYGGSSNYGQTSGYGANPYGSEPSAPPQRPGGYGGLGRTTSQDTVSTDAGRAALFGDAAQRNQRPQPGGPPQDPNDQSYSNYGQSSFQGGGGGGGGGGGYNGYPDRELTAEEQEEEDVQATKNEIRFIKQQDVASTRNARRIAEQAEATGRETLARLGQQGERIHNAERNLDLASAQNRIAQERASELKTLNRSMFAVHVSNPFTKGKREAEANQYVLDKHREERAKMDQTRAEAISSASRQKGFERGLQGSGSAGEKRDKKTLAQRSKYQFEADSEDDEMENEIDDNLDAIHRGAKTLNQLGQAMGKELDSQNKHITRITGKTDRVDDEIELNRARLNRIR
ncbi:Protein transport protein sec9 [Sphaceloma murrayae]|uniref:Protein transport protein sec9 n=1 Tax=Sphaceloma murrayae TaxID=2082308 RepID=A0A2K1R0N6_9PEZI|nr:Protein transport protein sec9 [Sphaceloma murrayae]